MKDHVLDQFGKYFLARYDRYKLSGATNLADLPTPISSVDLSGAFTPTHLKEIRKTPSPEILMVSILSFTGKISYFSLARVENEADSQIRSPGRSGVVYR